MKKKILFLIFISILFINITHAATGTNLFTLSNPDAICNAVKNKSMKVFVFNIKTSNSTLVSDNTMWECSNTPFFNNNLKNNTGESYNSWTWHGRKSPNYTYYSVEGEAIANTGDYLYFGIANEAQAYKPATGNTSGTLKRSSTLQPGDQILFTIDLPTQINMSSYANKDLRIELDYGFYANTDIDIAKYNSIYFYVVDTNGTSYSLPLADFELQERIKETEGDNSIYIQKYKLVSDNIKNAKNIPSNATIKQIRVAPYVEYNVQTGMFRMFDISIKSYSKYVGELKTKTKDSVTEGSVRQKIVNTMMEEATFKWNVPSGVNLYFRGSCGMVQHYDSSSGPFYGIPYVNVRSSTLSSFASLTTKKTTNNNFFWEFGNLSLTGNVYLYEGSKPQSSDGNGMYVAGDWKVNGSRLQGMDCSASTNYAIESNLSTGIVMNGSIFYLRSSDVKMLNGMSFITDKFEAWARRTNVIGANDHLTAATIKSNYMKYMKDEYGAQDIYEGYAQLRPGDIVARDSHTRMVTGYSVVRCGNSSSAVQNYSAKHCKGNIDPDNSYIITTEINSHTDSNDNINGFVNSINTGYDGKFKLNSKYTDLTNIDQMRGKPSTFKVNHKYSFKQLINQKYLPYRYLELANIGNTHVQVLPDIKKIGMSTADMLARNHILQGQIITNYLIEQVTYEIGTSNGVTKFYDYPAQTKFYSFYQNAPASVKQAINTVTTNSPNNMIIRVKVKVGANVNTTTNPDTAGVPNGKAGADSDGFEDLVLSINTSDGTDIITGAYNPIEPVILEDSNDPDMFEPALEESDDGEIPKDLTLIEDYVSSDSYDGQDYEVIWLSSDGNNDDDNGNNDDNNGNNNNGDNNNNNNNIDNPDTGSYISILSIILLVIIFYSISKYKNRYKRFNKI